MEEITELVSRRLFVDEDAEVFAVLDGASVPGLLEHLYRYEPDYECLYRGDLKPDLAEVAPYLIRIEPGSELSDWIIGQGWGKHWGIFGASHADIRTLRRHFRTFLMVHDSEGKPLYFRYYDPRVLRVYLPTCSAQELGVIFGPVNSYLVEDEDSNSCLRLRVLKGVLHQKRKSLRKSDRISQSVRMTR
jgi:hypothetical protein